MITLQRINTADVDHYRYMEQLLIQSFPKEEHNDLHILREHADCFAHYYSNVILDNDIPVGFILYWDFGDFYYVENVAIHPDQRNTGYGRQLFELLTRQFNRPIVLEVEPADEEIALRRINFYKRLQFVLWDGEYHQPSYRSEGDSRPMHLMVWGDTNVVIPPFDLIKNTLYKEVYNIYE